MQSPSCRISSKGATKRSGIVAVCGTNGHDFRLYNSCAPSVVLTLEVDEDLASAATAQVRQHLKTRPVSR